MQPPYDNELFARCAAASAGKSAADRIHDAELDIIDAIIDQAKKGSYAHAKFLFEYASGLTDKANAEYEASLAEILLRRLDQEEAERRDKLLAAQAMSEPANA